MAESQPSLEPSSRSTPHFQLYLESEQERYASIEAFDHPSIESAPPIVRIKESDARKVLVEYTRTYMSQDILSRMRDGDIVYNTLQAVTQMLRVLDTERGSQECDTKNQMQIIATELRIVCDCYMSKWEQSPKLSMLLHEPDAEKSPARHYWETCFTINILSMVQLPRMDNMWASCLFYTTNADNIIFAVSPTNRISCLIRICIPWTEASYCWKTMRLVYRPPYITQGPPALSPHLLNDNKTHARHGFVTFSTDDWPLVSTSPVYSQTSEANEWNYTSSTSSSTAALMDSRLSPASQETITSSATVPELAHFDHRVSGNMSSPRPVEPTHTVPTPLPFTTRQRLPPSYTNISTTPWPSMLTAAGDSTLLVSSVAHRSPQPVNTPSASTRPLATMGHSMHKEKRTLSD